MICTQCEGLSTAKFVSGVTNLSPVFAEQGRHDDRHRHSCRYARTMSVACYSWALGPMIVLQVQGPHFLSQKDSIFALPPIAILCCFKKCRDFVKRLLFPCTFSIETFSQLYTLEQMLRDYSSRPQLTFDQSETRALDRPRYDTTYLGSSSQSLQQIDCNQCYSSMRHSLPTLDAASIECRVRTFGLLEPNSLLTSLSALAFA